MAVPDTALITILTSAGVAGVFCVLFVLGAIYPKSVVDDIRAERDYERERANAERERADASVTAAQATRDVLSALQAGVTLGHQRHEERRSAAAPGYPAIGEGGPA
jgi:regulator of protease activity HflC (stomatin/prohibitin superfamily)